MAGAASYTVFARSTTSIAGNGHNDLWTELYQTPPGSVDPTLTKTIVATGIYPWDLNLNVPGAPWAFGNAIEFAVVATDRYGFISPIDTARTLSTSDKWGGMVSALSIDSGPAGPFASQVEVGDLFTRTLALSFTEPLSGLAPLPTLALSSGATTLVKTLASAVTDPSTGAISANANTASTLWYSLQLQSNFMPCTQVLATRVNGDILIPVRDSSIFTAGTRTVLMSFFGFAYSEPVVASVQPNLLTVQSPMAQQGFPAGTFSSAATTTVLCTLSGHGAAPVSGSFTTNFAGGAVPLGTDLRAIPLASAAQAAGFAIGQRVMVYEPSTGNIAAVADLRNVIGVDTAFGILYVDAPLTVGNSTSLPVFNAHSSQSVVFQLPLAETPLRPSFDLSSGANGISLRADVTSGGPFTQLVFTPPGGAGYAFGLPLVVGDSLLLDTDGDLSTTSDQSVVTVKSVVCKPNTGNPLPALSNATCVVTVDATGSPALQLATGRSLIYSLGDTFIVAGTTDTSGNAALNPRGNSFSIGGPIFRY